MGAIVERKESTAVAMSHIESTAQRIVEQGLCPMKKVDGEYVPALTWQQLAIIGQRGKEIGVDPVQAMNEIYIVQNKPMFKAELVLELMYKNIAGFSHMITKWDEKEVEAVFYSAQLPKEGIKRSLTREYADNAQWSLQKNWKTKNWEVKDNWKKDPIGMLFNRLISQVSRTQFPQYKTLISIELPSLEVAEESISQLVDVTPATELPELVETPVGKVDTGTGEVVEALVTPIKEEVPEEEALEEEAPVVEPTEEEAVAEEMLSCFKCKADITQKIAEFSKGKYGMRLCYACQDEVKQSD